MIAHAPATHPSVPLVGTGSWLQSLPHAPQLRVSVWVSVQTCPASTPASSVEPQVALVPQSRTQAPALHLKPMLHALPHLPQFFESVSGTTQMVPHLISFAAQFALH